VSDRDVKIFVFQLLSDLRNSGGMFDDSQASLTFPSGTSYVEALRQKPEGRGSDSRWGNYDFLLT